MSKTNKGLIEYAKAQLGHPYWYGCFGQVSTKELYSVKKKQYPQQYTWACPTSQLGVRVYDCIGLIKGYLWSDSTSGTPKYTASQDVSANGMLDKCKEKGKISTMPDLPGVLVFMPGHVGVYIGDGYVIEARGHAYGVVKTKLNSRSWVNWGKCPWITYTAESKPAPAPAPAPAKPAEPVAEKVMAVGKVTASALNLRKGASTKFSVITVLKNGTSVYILGRSGNWYKVKYNNITGYVKAEYIAWTGTVTGSTVNVRKGPGLGHDIYFAIPRGSKVTVIDSSKSWYKVKVAYKGKTYIGYMSTAYIA